MLLSQEIKDKIISEYNSFKENLYAGKSLDERKELDDNNDYYVDQEIEGGTTGKYKSETNRSKDKSKK